MDKKDCFSSLFDLVTIIKSVVNHPTIAHTISLGIAFLCGCIAGFVNFANNFHVSICELLRSFPCLAYMLFSGLITILAYSCVLASNMVIFGFSVSTHPYLSACMIGLAGYSLLTTVIPKSVSSDKDGSKGISSFITNTQSFLYHRYIIERDATLRPDVCKAMKNVPIDRIKEFIYSCTAISIESDKIKGNIIGKQIAEHLKSPLNQTMLKTQIGVDIAKFLGLQAVKEIAAAFADDNQLDKDVGKVTELEDKIALLNRLMAEEDK